MPRKRVLIVIGQLGIGGAERELVTFLHAAPKEEFEFYVASHAQGGHFREEIERLTGRAVVSPPGRGRIGRLLWMRRLVIELRPDIVHAWTLAPMFYLRTLWLIWKVFKARPCPLIAFLQNVPKQTVGVEIPLILFRYLVGAPDGLVSNCRAALRELAEMGIHHSRTEVVHNGVQEEFFDTTASAEALSRRSGRPVAIGLGRLIQRKRADWMVRALRSLQDEGVRFQLWLVGDGPVRHQLAQLAHDLGVSDNVVFWGERTDSPQILKAADILLHCAWAEGLPNAVQEAMASGLPVVAPRISGIPEIVTDSVEGFLYDPESLDDCIGAIRRLLENERLRLAMGAAARKRAAECFEPAVAAGHMCRFYKTVLESWRPHGRQHFPIRLRSEL